MHKANYQIMSGWLITFEIACDGYVRATRGQNGHEYFSNIDVAEQA